MTWLVLLLKILLSEQLSQRRLLLLAPVEASSRGCCLKNR